ncbi:MAG TPA: cell surface protein SprA [Gemmatimonadales bacterium]|nr:cell surface protein SprA [Gemmatimonadales bacterium]
MARLLVALGCLLLLPRLLAAQEADTGVGLRLHFERPLPGLQQPVAMRLPWLGAPRRSVDAVVAEWDSGLEARRQRDRATWASARTLATLYGTRAVEEVAREEAARGAFGLPEKYADLTIEGTAFLEVRTERLKNERCTPALLLDPSSGCKGGFQAPRIDTDFDARVGGVIGQRLHINVDYDSKREFNANNDLQVYYEGLQDEIVRRVEVGTVTFRPPASRFLTSAIPNNNFGINATFEVGPFQLQGMAATQEGSVVTERTYTVGATTSQPQDRQVRDLDFESGRFFWAVDPALLSGYPFLDALSLSDLAVPDAVRPAQLRVYRYRTGVGSGLNPNLGGIEAIANRPDSPQTVDGVWQLLIQGTDYYIDPSGLWFALGTRLDQNDYLAVSYITRDGTQVGTFPAEDDPTGADTLRLVSEPNQGVEVPTFRYEMRQFYRVAGADLDRGSLRISVSLNQSERPSTNAAETYLALFGLAIPTDPHIFDLDNRLFPRTRDPGAELVLRDAYLAFPTLQPFIDPRLAPAERADSLYRTPQYLILTAQGPPSRFQLRLQYNSTGAGDRGTLNLNVLQIRRGSEQLVVGGRVLRQGEDYDINYDLGQVTFLSPETLFGAGAGFVSARFEERGVFAIAPTSIFGATLRYALGEAGSVNLIGMYQKEQTVYSRPQLGFEPTANMLMGVTTELTFAPRGVTRFFDRLSPQTIEAPSRLDLRGEYGFARPDPNRSGQAYLEDFEADASIPVSLREVRWEYGSVPQFPDGAEALGFAGGFDSASAVQVTWQNLVPACSGCPPVELHPEDIDPTIIITGTSSTLETVLYTTMHADTAGGMVQNNNSSRWSQPRRDFQPRWRSMVTSLSQTGLDLTRAETLEFWVFQGFDRPADSAGVKLIFDLGTVNEDALALAPDTLTTAGSDSLFTGRQYTGAGRLDTERSATGIFNASTDDIGILIDRVDTMVVDGIPIDEVQTCERILSSSVPVYPWGDLSSRCTVGNGYLDTEDLNGDNRLNATGGGDNVFRWVVDPGNLTQYYVRDGASITDQQGRVAKWSLYRIPLRFPEHTLGTPNLRLAQHLRITLAAPPDDGNGDIVARFALARMRFIAAPWVRRTETPIAGISGSTGEPNGAVFATIISTENTEAGYTSPPGVVDESSRNDEDQGSQGIQVNEKSLRIVGTDLLLGQRAEAYRRFPSGAQNVLKYRTLRVWMRGRGDGWESGDLEAFVKLGSDPRNFYLYRAPARTSTWEPELRIELETWRRLRAEVETNWLQGLPPSGAAACGIGDTTAYVACDGPYLVHVADPNINPPNLAAVQEVAAGIYRVADLTAFTTAELWVDDLRLDEPISNVGDAMAFDGRLQAADVGELSASYVREDGLFQQIGRDPTYRTTGAFQLGTGVRIEKFLPSSLGLTLPATLSYSRTSVDPLLISGTDIRGQDLDNLRKPSSWTATYSLSVRRIRRGSTWMARGLLDPLALSGTYTTGKSQTELSKGTLDVYTLTAGYNLSLARAGPSFSLSGLVDKLPEWLKASQAAQDVRSSTFSVVPTNFRFSSGLTRNQSEFTSYLVPVERASDASLRPALSLSHLWRNAAGLTWQPVGMLTLSGDLASTRDLRDYPDSTSLGRVVSESRDAFLGMDVGVERDRTMGTTLVLQAPLTTWLRPRYATTSSFVLSRSLTSRDPVREFGDSGAYILPQTLNNVRNRDVGAALDLGLAFRNLMKDSSVVARALRGLRPFDISTGVTRLSTYDLATFDPGLGYMLALGGMDDFISQGEDSALSVSETHRTTFSGGADLPYGFVLTLSYSQSDVDRLSRVSDGYLPSATSQREWPIGQIRWTRAIRSGFLSAFTLSTGIREREGRTELPSSGATARTLTESSTWQNDLQLTFRNGISMRVGYNETDDVRENNGTRTIGDGRDLTANLIYAFRLPGSVSRARKQLRSSLSAVLSKSLSCLNRQDTSDCLTVSDVRRQEIRGGLDTDLTQIVTGGLHGAWSVNDARHLNRKTSQITISATFQISLFAGDYR